MRSIKVVEPPRQVKSKEPFELTIQFTTSDEGLSANLKVKPYGRFKVSPTEIALPLAKDGDRKTVKVIIERLEPAPSACMLAVTLGDLVDYAAPEVV